MGENNIKIFNETGCKSMNWLHVAQDRFQLWVLTSMVRNLRVPLKAGYFLTS
jgi:hypothetical protein